MKAGARQERTLFYQKHLYERVLPFWLQNGVDSDYGGYFTCFSNYGDELVSTDKYVWSQGRMVWLFATLAEMDAAPEEIGLGMATPSAGSLFFAVGSLRFPLDSRWDS